MKQIYILGVGRNTPVYIDLIEACGYQVAGLYHYNDERTGETDHGFQIIGSHKDLFSAGSLSGLSFALSMGDNEIRTSLAEQIKKKGGDIPCLIHPTAIISRFAKIHEGVSVGAFSIVQADSEVGAFTVILSGVNISHNNKIGKGCFFAGGATLGAYTTVDDYVFMGQGALTISDKVPHIGKQAYIGARSLVTRTVEAHSTVAGSPAKVIHKK